MINLTGMIPAPKVNGFGIVYTKDGWPKVSAEFIAGLTDSQRTALARELLVRGFRLNGFEIVEDL